MQLIAVSASGDSGPELVGVGGGAWIRMVPAPWGAASPGTRSEAPEREA